MKELLGCLFSILLGLVMAVVAVAGVLWLRLRQFLHGPTRPEHPEPPKEEEEATDDDDQGEYVDYEEIK